MRIQQNGIDFDTQTNENERRCQTYSPKIEDVFVKNIGVVTAAAAHQNKTQCDKGDADEHEQIVFLLEDKFLLWWSVRRCPLFFSHAANLVKSYWLLRHSMVFDFFLVDP